MFKINIITDTVCETKQSYKKLYDYFFKHFNCNDWQFITFQEFSNLCYGIVVVNKHNGNAYRLKYRIGNQKTEEILCDSSDEFLKKLEENKQMYSKKYLCKYTSANELAVGFVNTKEKKIFKIKLETLIINDIDTEQCLKDLNYIWDCV